MKFSIERDNYSYKDSINQLLSVCYADDVFSKVYFERGWKSPFNVCTFIAKNNVEVMGVITSWKSTFHPNCMYFSIVVHPLYRKKGIEKQLLEYVEANQNIDLPLQTSIWETSYSSKDFYDQNGFIEIRRTYTSSLNISVLEDFESLYLQKVSFPYASIKSLREISNNEELKTKLVSFVKTIYENTHKVNPPGVNDLTIWEKLIFNKDTLLEGSYIALSDQHNILGFALLHTGEDSNNLEFGWRGIEENIDMNLVILLTILQMRFARKIGYKKIDGEIDTTDNFSMEMLKILPFSPSPSFITYQK